MGVRIDIVSNETTTVSSSQNEQKIIDVDVKPSVLTSNTVQTVVLEVLKGARGDDRVFIGNTPPGSPQEGQIWIDTSGG